MSLRWVVLLALLGGSAWLVLWAPAGQTGVVDAAPRARHAAAVPTGQAAERAKADEASSADASFAAVLVHREATADDVVDGHRPMLGDPFATRDWAPRPKAVQSTAAPEPTPAAPTFPFSYLGKQRVDGAWEVFLARGEQTLIVREGQTFDGDTYRVESIRPPTLLLTYLPLAHQQALTIGGEE